MQLRFYQLAVVPALLHSIRQHLGLTFVIVFPRQSGKDEFLVWLKAWLLGLFSFLPVGIVEFNPTHKPQTVTAMARFEAALDSHQLTRKRWRKRGDFMRRMGKAWISFLSGDGAANVVGATASLLLIINEAQDIEAAVYDKKSEPMTASTNATRLFAGTVWTSSTLLAREIHAAREAERRDGMRRVFLFTADDVRKVVPWYGTHVDNVVKKLGRQHPLVKTQYFCEQIDAVTGMFHAARLALMLGDQPEQAEPTAGHVYGFLVDVGGQDEALTDLEGMGNPGRDYTRLSIVDVDLSSLELLQAPTYRIVKRLGWQGVSHLKVFGQLSALADAWGPLYIVMDATGVGEGLWAMMDKAHPTRVLPIKFTAQVKSELGYGYIAVIETGRARDCCPTDESRIQYQHCKSEILPGPAKTMRWGVKDGTRFEGELVHDDIPVADSLMAVLDKQEWSIQSETLVVPGVDPLRSMDRNF
ncbi:MAG: hypothetical protein HY869_20970 [Chloroflexi bacterium]|nr:hypothetical protein [Chloroflexota bacterium]